MIKIGTKDWQEYKDEVDRVRRIKAGYSLIKHTVEGFYDWLAAGKPKLAAKLHVKHL